MRDIRNLDKNWLFTKEDCGAPAALPTGWEPVDLPHTWNAIDGQDGGSDFYRGRCWYAKELTEADLPQGDVRYLELRGANASADVYLNGRHLAHHDGGYSTWRVALPGPGLLAVAVDNSPSETVYPQMADFTFYGGLYRDVYLIGVPESHFDLDYHGGPGLKVTPAVEGNTAKVTVETFLTCKKPGQQVKVTLTDGEGREAASTLCDGKAELVIENVRRWHGRKDPYLYTATAELLEGETVQDTVSARFGCRTFAIDPERGFLLNGEEYPLHGVCRHQDRLGVGNALLPEHHRQDMDIICELGANTLRLAHYQHDQYFYDLCDERGLVVWAEIPYISQHMPGGRENTVSQMKELIVQNYNHPSIVVWGLSNEITMRGGENEDLIENHRILNDLCHEMDPTRLTTLAAVSMCPTDAATVHMTDVVSYNLYFGWYGGTIAMNGPWLDDFHKAYPHRPIGLSEYGCDALNWHSSKPMQGDYSEDYQAHYHEELIKQLFSRKYIWATHVWNMFDFGADNRDEGGEAGQNHKGLVTFDRTYKKDAFYAYKAWLSDEPFVHIGGKRYVDRVEDVTRVTVYSNRKTVELFANGESLGVQEAEDHFFRFDVPNRGETKLTAVSGDLRDESLIRKVDTFNDDYRFKEKGAILNWFDVTQPEGCLSLNSSIREILATEAGNAVVGPMIDSMAPKEGDKAAGFVINADMLKMMGGFTLLRMMNMLGAGEKGVTKEQLLSLNEKLNQIKKAD